MTEFSRRQTTGCVELFLLACYILITRVYERILPCMYCITMSVTQNAVCNCEIKSILTYLLTPLQNFTSPSSPSSLAMTVLGVPLSSRPSVLKRRYISLQNE